MKSQGQSKRLNHWLHQRVLAEPEQMDGPGVDAKRLQKALRFIRLVNHWLGYSFVMVRHLEAVTRDLPMNHVVRILDVATGSADVPVLIQKWAKRRNRMVNIVGLDLHQTTLDFAATCAPDVPLVRGDALQLPFENNSFDVVITSMFLHHLPDVLAVDVLREMHRVGAHGIIAADLLRTAAAHRWATLFTLWADPMVKHDARISVKQAFTLDEARTICSTAGLNQATITRHFAHRFVISILKNV
jgi:SAM-dependent methyltransferase